MAQENNFHVDIETAPKDQIFYTLTMFPYPSGYGLHVGHMLPFVTNDIVARFFRMKGKTVINPMGRDSFGLPTENFAIKNNKSARQATKENIENFKRQLSMIDFSFDRDREVTTSNPDYYKWTQWIFAKLFDAGLVYRKEAFVNRCPVDQTVLANDQVVDGCCERCGTEIIQKKHLQWFIKITDYADKLIADLDTIDRPEETKIAQRNWIGRSEGALIQFSILNSQSSIHIEVFTTRADTVYGVTAVVLAPENTLIDELIPVECKQTVLEYRKITSHKTAVERQQGEKDKTGVFSGVHVTHPLTGEPVPVRFADYVLMDYGTGAVMFVPAHDERDWEFALKHGLPVKEVIEPEIGEKHPDSQVRKSINAIIRNPKTNMYLTTNRGEKLGGYLFIGGGVDENEDLLEAALREIAEETGYINLKLIQQTESVVHYHYFAHSKNKHTYRQSIGFLFELADDTQKPVMREHGEEFTLEWLTEQQAEQKVLDPMHAYFFKKLVKKQPYTGTGRMVNSGQFDGITNIEAKKAIVEYLETLGLGKKKTTYRLRDRSVSRQRYRGAPIPVYYDEQGQPQLIPYDELPVVLPLDLENYKPSGKSPLEDHPTFPHYQHKNGKIYRRECDTLDTFMCSSFYFLRFLDPQNDKELVCKEFADKSLPVDFYIGGKEHTVGHLLYSRFIHKFLFDQGYLSCSEPFAKLFHQGMVLGPDGRKMSKRWGNVVTPDDVIDKYNADTLRTYVMFMGPLEQEKAWDDNSVKGVSRFLDRVDKLTQFLVTTEKSKIRDQKSDPMIHKTIKGVTKDMEQLGFNTAVSKLMIFVNHVYDVKVLSKSDFESFLKLLAPFATKLVQQLREKLGNTTNIHFEPWPTYDEAMIADEAFDLPVQIGGKMRGTLNVKMGLEQDEILKIIQESGHRTQYLEGKELKKVIYVKDKIINLILSS